jgi:TolB-like protein
MQAPQEHEIRQQIEKILLSPRFKETTRSRRFLEFIVQEALTGNSADLKENVVGVSVFDRSADYDPRLDSIVRVEAGRLRTKLNDYYAQEGRDDRLIVALPKGSYAPEFAWRVQAQSDPASTPAHPDSVLARKFSIRKTIVAIAAAAVAVSVGIASLQPATPEVRIAVLPFTSYSSDARDQMIADQLMQKVTAEFVKLGTFDVVPSTSARRYEDRRPGVQEIAAALQADILLEGRTTTGGKNIKVEIRLSDGALDRKFWVGDEFAGESVDEVAQQIALAASVAATKRKP